MITQEDNEFARRHALDWWDFSGKDYEFPGQSSDFADAVVVTVEDWDSLDLNLPSQYRIWAETCAFKARAGL